MSKFKPSSPLAIKVSDRLMQAFRGSPEVVASDLAGQKEIENSTANNPAERRQRRMSFQLRDLNQDSYDRSRRGRYSDFREMRDEVPEMATALQVMVDFVFGGDAEHETRIAFKEDATENYRTIVNSIINNVGGMKFFIDVFREGMCLGDSFSELIYTKAELLSQRPLIPDTVDVVNDQWSRLLGYTVNTPGASYDKSKNAVRLLPVQVLHYTPDRMRGHRYGRSMWATARKLWRQSESTEDVMTLLSLLQAAARKSVAYPVSSNIRPDELNDLMENLKSGNWSEQVFEKDGTMRRRVASMLAMDDVVYPYREGTTSPTFHNEQPANLSQLITVLEYIQNRFFIVTGVPAALCGFEKNINARATLEQQGLQFARTVKRKQNDVRRIVQTVIMRGLVAAGQQPDLLFEVQLPPVSAFDEKLKAEVQNIKANTAKVWSVDLGISMPVILSDVFGFSDEKVNSIMTATQVEALMNRTDQEVDPTVLFQDVLEATADAVRELDINLLED